MTTREEHHQTHGAARVRWHRVETADALAIEARDRILQASYTAIAQRGAFTIVLAGGTTPRAVYRLLRVVDSDWSRWHVYFGDERCVPRDDADRNDLAAMHAWLAHVEIPHAQIHLIPAEFGAVEGAESYSSALDFVGPFDLVLLGLGEDGHTASLFPGRDLGDATDAPDALAVHDAPKPPSDRVTMSLARLNRSRTALFLVSGEGKREAVRKWRAGESIPASLVHPSHGVDVLVDAAADSER